MNILPKIFQPSDDQKAAKIHDELLHWEALVGGQLFGPVPKGHSRQFFCLDEHTWVWHETWKDAKGQQQAITTHYNVRPDGVLKTQDGQTYQRISPREAQNLFSAAAAYYQRVEREYRYRLQTA